jgi:CSLREA domain-containing protein
MAYKGERNMRKPGWRAMVGLALACAASAVVAAPTLAESDAGPGRVISVDSSDDAPDAAPGDGRCATATGACSLRAALQEANATAGADAVFLPAGLYRIAVPGAAEDAAASGDLDISDDLNLTGAGALTTVVDGSGLDGVFQVLPGVRAELRGITVRGGHTAALVDAAGGIFNQGTLYLGDCRVEDNQGSDPYGVGGVLNMAMATIERTTFERNGPQAIESYGMLDLYRTVLHDNGPGVGVSLDDGSLTIDASEIADQRGTAIFSQGETVIAHTRILRSHTGGAILVPAGRITVLDSTIEENWGGGINNDGRLRVERSTLRANHFPDDAESVGTGGGIAGATAQTGVTNTDTAVIIDSSILDHRYGGLVNEEGAMTLVNVTVSGNSSPLPGGGIANYADLDVRNSTITANRVIGDDPSNVGGGGIATGSELHDIVARLSNTIVAGNSSTLGGAPDCAGTIDSLGHNLVGDGAGCGLVMADGDRVGLDPKLGPLADNGGPTRTHALLDGSPALDAGNPNAPDSGDGACAATDQRGAGRPQGAACDIGAFEAAVHCGNGVVDAGEACDDGNGVAGDCCSPRCTFEAVDGDCNADGTVDIAELVTGVGIAVGETRLEACVAVDGNGDADVTIAELVRAVTAALQGCQHA